MAACMYKRMHIFSQIIPFLLQQSTKTTLSKMNKLIFLTGLLTALLFIGTAHGGPYNRKASELEQQILQAMIQDSTGVMEAGTQVMMKDDRAETQFLGALAKALATLFNVGYKVAKTVHCANNPSQCRG